MCGVESNKNNFLMKVSSLKIPCASPGGVYDNFLYMSNKAAAVRGFQDAILNEVTRVEVFDGEAMMLLCDWVAKKSLLNPPAKCVGVVAQRGWRDGILETSDLLVREFFDLSSN